MGTLSTDSPFTARTRGNSCGGNGVLVLVRSRWSEGDQRVAASSPGSMPNNLRAMGLKSLKRPCRSATTMPSFIPREDRLQDHPLPLFLRPPARERPVTSCRRIQNQEDDNGHEQRSDERGDGQEPLGDDERILAGLVAFLDLVVPDRVDPLPHLGHELPALVGFHDLERIVEAVLRIGLCKRIVRSSSAVSCWARCAPPPDAARRRRSGLSARSAL